MKCSNCSKKHNPLSLFDNLKYQLKESDRKNFLSVCGSCGSIIRCTNFNVYFYFLGGYTLLSIALYITLLIVMVEVLPENSPEMLETFLMMGYLMLFIYGMFVFPAYFMKYETVTDQTVNLTINSVRSPGWKVLGAYLVTAVLITILIFFSIDIASIKGLWFPIIFVIYFAVLLYLAGLILLRYTEREIQTGTSFNFKE